MRRALSVWFPLFPIDVWHRRRRGHRHDADLAVLLTTTVGQRRVIASRCAHAARAGVRRGMPLGQARAVLPAGRTHIEEHDPLHDSSVLRALAIWAHRFSPVVAMDAPDGLLIDITGCDRVFRGETRLVAQLQDALAAMGFRSRCAVAPTFVCASGLVRCARRRTVFVEDGKQRDALQPLPLRALGLDEDVIEAFEDVGIEQVGHLMEMPRDALPARFGEQVLLRLKQALGEALEMIDPVRPLPPPCAESVLDGPVCAWEAIEIVVCRVLEDLEAVLRSRGCGVLTLDVRMDRSDAPPTGTTISLSRPRCDKAHLWQLLRPKVERIDLGYGIERVSMTATRTGPMRHEQAQQWGGAERLQADVAAGELADMLVNRLGSDRVLRAAIMESHVPERVARLHSVLDSREADGRVTTGDRPTLLLTRPEPAEVVLVAPEGPVMRVRWAGNDRVIDECRGPERIDGEWWRGAHGSRDYFKVRDDRGRWLWLFRQRSSRRWFVHGVWA
jgi:protein ImuB